MCGRALAGSEQHNGSILSSKLKMGGSELYGVTAATANSWPMRGKLRERKEMEADSCSLLVRTYQPGVYSYQPNELLMAVFLVKVHSE